MLGSHGITFKRITPITLQESTMVNINTIVASTNVTKKTNKKGKKIENPNIPRALQPCALCDIVGHPTNIFPKLDELKPLLSI